MNLSRTAWLGALAATATAAFVAAPTAAPQVTASLTAAVAGGKIVMKQPTVSPGSSTASGRCSRATARQLVNKHHLNGFLLRNPVDQLLCGPFTGPGSEAMAVTIGPAPTCWPIQNWAVFSFRGGAWQLVLDQPAYLVPPLVAVGSHIRETTAVHRRGDPRCIPSGGSHARIWHWNGTRFRAGAWKQVTPPTGTARPTSASFLSPSRNLSCEMRTSYVYCQSVKLPHSVTMSLNARLTICRGTRCLGNPGENTPALAYGKQITVGRFRCRSLRTGIECVVVQSGKGFLINSDGVHRIGP